MSLMVPERHCSRMLCNAQAAATLVFHYHQQTAHLGPLAADPEPHTYDLCGMHALNTSAPVGWELTREALAVVDGDDLEAVVDAVREPDDLQAHVLPEPLPAPAPEAALTPQPDAAPQAAARTVTRAEAAPPDVAPVEDGGKRRGRRRKQREIDDAPAVATTQPAAPSVEPGRRGHLRLVVDNTRSPRDA